MLTNSMFVFQSVGAWGRGFNTLWFPFCSFREFILYCCWLWSVLPRNKWLLFDWSLLLWWGLLTHWGLLPRHQRAQLHMQQKYVLVIIHAVGNDAKYKFSYMQLSQALLLDWINTILLLLEIVTPSPVELMESPYQILSGSKMEALLTTPTWVFHTKTHLVHNSQAP